MGSISVPTALMMGGAASAGGGILSGIMGSNASKSAASAETAAANEAIALEQANLATTTSNLQPYMTAGTNALSSMQKLLGIGTGAGGGNGQADYTGFTSSPGYQFMLNQGNQNIANSATARGGTSGNTLKALQQFGQQSAGTSYQQFLQNLSSVAGSGQNAASTLGQIGANVTGNMGAQTIGAGNANAAGTVGSSNALSGAVNSGLGAVSSTVGGLAGNAQLMALLAPYINGTNSGGGGGNVFSDMGF